MYYVILILLSVEKARIAQRHGYHALWAASKLVKCMRMAGKAGWFV